MKKLNAVIFTLLAAVFILPVIATVALSFMVGGMPSMQGYADLLFDCFVFYPQFWNSVIYAAVITIVQLAVIIPCAFGFSQAQFKGKGALFVFADCWNMVEQPMLFLKDDSLKTLSVFISNAGDFSGKVLFPAAVLFLIPVMILYMFFNEYLEKGLTLGELS